MSSAKMATLGLLKMKVFWNKGYDVVISVYDTINKNLARDSNYIVDVVMRPSLVTLALLWEKLLKFNNLGLALGMGLKFYTSVARGL